MSRANTVPHTPGPWAVNPTCAQVDSMPSRLPICQMLWPTEARGEAETMANAHVVAAAPDVLHALKQLRHVVRHFWHDDSPFIRELDSACEASDIAIARAEAGA